LLSWLLVLLPSMFFLDHGREGKEVNNVQNLNVVTGT
jgi:hypothetical protein